MFMSKLKVKQNLQTSTKSGIMPKKDALSMLMLYFY